MKRSIAELKAIYGDEEIRVNERGQMNIPEWLAAVVLEYYPVKTRKNRRLKKHFKKTVLKLIEAGLEAEK